MFAASFSALRTLLEPAMSKAELEALRNAVLALSESERAELARDLVASLDGPHEDDVARAWDIEICRRINEIEAGKAQLLDVEDVLSRARARLST
jgi:putative addiction module component (TIGR02574 family)